MIRTKKRMRLCAVLLACILVFIWGNSLMPAGVSERFSDSVQDFLLGMDEGSGSSVLRKVAHFTEFAALGMCLGWLFGMLGKGRVRPLILGIAAAFVDETIQIFVPGRASQLRDVAIDSCGAAAGLFVLWIGYHFLQKRSTKPTSEDL